MNKYSNVCKKWLNTCNRRPKTDSSSTETPKFNLSRTKVSYKKTKKAPSFSYDLTTGGRDAKSGGATYLCSITCSNFSTSLTTTCGK